VSRAPRNPNGTVARGYNEAHKRLRAHWAPKVSRGDVCCARCGRPIPPAGLGPCPAVRNGRRCGKDHGNWVLGHDDWDRSIYLGPEHACCSTAAATRKRVAVRRATRPLRLASRIW
jgi:hypothetical protein